MAAITIPSILNLARLRYRGCKDEKVYKWFLEQIEKFPLTESRFKELDRELKEVLGV
jgi:hypothetical protein